MGCELTGDKNRLRFLGGRGSGTDSSLGDCTVKAACSLCPIPAPQAVVSSQRGLRRARGWWWRWKEPCGPGADKAGGSGLTAFQQALPLAILRRPQAHPLQALSSLSLFAKTRKKIGCGVRQIWAQTCLYSYQLQLLVVIQPL